MHRAVHPQCCVHQQKTTKAKGEENHQTVAQIVETTMLNSELADESTHGADLKPIHLLEPVNQCCPDFSPFGPRSHIPSKFCQV